MEFSEKWKTQFSAGLRLPTPLRHTGTTGKRTPSVSPLMLSGLGFRIPWGSWEGAESEEPSCLE